MWYFWYFLLSSRERFSAFWLLPTWFLLVTSPINRPAYHPVFLEKFTKHFIYIYQNCTHGRQDVDYNWNRPVRFHQGECFQLAQWCSRLRGQVSQGSNSCPAQGLSCKGSIGCIYWCSIFRPNLRYWRADVPVPWRCRSSRVTPACPQWTTMTPN